MSKEHDTKNELTSFLDVIMSLDKKTTVEKLELNDEQVYHSEDLVKIKTESSELYVSEARWNDYMEFTKQLEQDVESFKRKNIFDFWRHYEVVQAERENLLPWIDGEKLAQAKENILSNKDKQHTRCFDDLVMYKKPLLPQDFSIFDKLDQEHPNFKNVTAFYRGAFAMNRTREIKKYQSPKPVLLLGNPGIGKTHYAKKLAQLLGTNYRFFDANSINGGWVLSGNNATWRGADAGLIFSELAKSETISPIILLDEIDKVRSESFHSPFSTFHQMFEKENAKSFFDEFVGTTFDASKIIYIVTANDINNIAPSLLSRMTVFTINNPSSTDMRQIVQTIYEDILDGSKMFTKRLAESEIDKLVNYSPREVSQILATNIHHSASAAALSKTNRPKKLMVNTDILKTKNKLGF